MAIWVVPNSHDVFGHFFGGGGDRPLPKLGVLSILGRSLLGPVLDGPDVGASYAHGLSPPVYVQPSNVPGWPYFNFTGHCLDRFYFYFFNIFFAQN